MDENRNKQHAEMLRYLRSLLDAASRSAPAGFINSLDTADIKTELMATAVGALPDLLDLAEEALKRRAVVMPPPCGPKPKERLRIVFEEIDDFEPDADGLWWNLPDSGVVSAARSCPVANVIPLRRTVERIEVKPERWAGRCKTIQPRPDEWFAVVTISHGGDERPRVEMGCSSFPTREQAKADMALLKALAADYAAHHGAVIDWPDQA